MTKQEQNIKLEHIRLASLYAHAQTIHWSIFAGSTTNHNRIISKGGKRMTSLELEADAFNTADNHLRRMNELQDAMIEILSTKTTD